MDYFTEDLVEMVETDLKTLNLNRKSRRKALSDKYEECLNSMIIESELESEDIIMTRTEIEQFDCFPKCTKLCRRKF